MKKMFISCISLLFVLLSFSSIAAAQETKFSLIMPAKVQVGKEFEVTVHAKSLVDLYGYEIQLKFDNTRMKYIKATASWTGYSVPIVKENVLTFAHTKLGNAAGENGSKDLVTFVFEGLSEGTVDLELSKAKLVKSDSSLPAETVNIAIKKGITILNAPVSFSDVKGHWGEAAIERAASLGLVNGYSDGSFRPNGNVTRAEFTVMLARALQLPTASESVLWNDMDQIPKWAKSYIDQVYAAGIVKGYEDKSFKPQNKINRAELTVMLIRALNPTIPQDKKSTFADAVQIPNWAQSYVAYAQEEGIVNGRGNNKFESLELATRAEAVTLILRILDRI